jgi:hypothetical protein
MFSVRFPFVPCAFVITALACSTPTVVTNEWRNPSYTAGPLNKVIVVGANLDDSRRRALETGFVSALTSRGAQATASYTLYPGALPSATDAQSRLFKAGFDGILISTMSGTTERSYLESRADWDAELYGDYWRSVTREPDPYVRTHRYVKFETVLWSALGSGNTIWSAQTLTENPASGPDFVRSLVSELIPAMERDGLVSTSALGVSMSAPWRAVPAESSRPRASSR